MKFSILATSKVISGWYHLVTAHTHGVFRVLPHWDISTMSHPDQSLLYPNNAERLAWKWHISIFTSLVWLNQDSNPWVRTPWSTTAGNRRSGHKTIPSQCLVAEGLQKVRLKMNNSCFQSSHRGLFIYWLGGSSPSCRPSWNQSRSNQAESNQTLTNIDKCHHPGDSASTSRGQGRVISIIDTHFYPTPSAPGKAGVPEQTMSLGGSLI